MGSDSRTATATSSKSRPSWRDRHLSQLSDEQLDDVKKHRAATGSINTTDAGASRASEKSSSAAQLAGIDGMETAAGRNAKTEVEAPRRQAGPDRDSGRETPYERAGRESGSGTGNRADNLNRHNRSRQQQERRPLRETERTESRASGAPRPVPRHGQPARQPDTRNGRDDHRHHYEREAKIRAERSSVDADRKHRDYRDYGADHSISRAPAERPQDRRDNTRRRSGRAPESKRPNLNKAAAANMPAPEQALQGDAPAKKSIVNRLLDFKLNGPVKYGLMALAIAVMIAVSLMKPIDNSSQSQLDSALTRAMIGFGLARTLNGVISVAQGTEFAVQPAGVGVNFSPGEILDPINDLVERFSWVMLLATSSLGVQKILLEVSSWAGISVLLGGAGLFFLLTRMRNSSLARMADIAGKLLLVMILVRFLIPVGSLANDWVYKQFLQPQYEQSSEQLEIASTRIREISARQTQAEKNDGSLKERAKSLYNSMTAKFDFDGMLNDYKDSAENVSEHAISLIVVFTLQTVVFPLLFLYLIYRLFRSVLLPSRSSN